ncbi:MAG: RnfABCDGE type electron transport complex subunit D [Bacilli bacterium]
MNIVTGTAPFIRPKRTTSQIMIELLIGLGVIFIASVTYNFILGVNYGVKTILIMLISIVVSLVSDLIAGSLRYKKSKHGAYDKYILSFIKENFSVVTGVILALTLPVGTPYYVVVVGNLFATLIVKHAFGGFGNNIFNPAALGRLFVLLAFGPTLVSYLSEADKSIGGLSANAGLTITSHFSQTSKWLSSSLTNTNVSMLDLYLGNYSGALGETFTLLIIVIGIVLAARKVINWRTPVFLFGTVALSSIFISLVTKANVGEYLLLQFGLGGLVFGAIFMFTDPVTSPTSNFGKALIGIIGGLFNVLIRLGGSFPEGTAFSIALVNVFSPMIDKLYSGRTNVKIWRHYVVTGSFALASIGILTGVSAAKLGPPPIEPEIIPFVIYEGKSEVMDPLNNPQKQFQVEAKVGLSNEYEIVTLELTNFSTPDRFKNDEIENVIKYYTSITLEQFKALTPPEIEAGVTKSNQSEEPYILKNNIYTSKAIYDAINDALGNIDVYHGQSKKYYATQYNSFEAKASVFLNEYYEIVNLKLEEYASPLTYLNETQTKQLIDYYSSLNVAEFKALPAPLIDEDYDSPHYVGPTLVNQEGEHIIPARIYSSVAIYEAIDNALEDIGVYVGEHLDYPREGLPLEEENKMLMKVNVYVDEKLDLIKSVDILEGASTSEWKSKWEKMYPLILRKYYDLNVDYFKTLVSHQELYASDLYVGASVSANRLFNATQNALEGYGL